MKRALYFACYDIRDKKRLRKSLNVMKGYSSGKQYSCFECFLTEKERERLLEEIGEVTSQEDAFALIKITDLHEQRLLGRASAPCDQKFLLF